MGDPKKKDSPAPRMEPISETTLTAFLNEFRLFPDGLRRDIIADRTGLTSKDLPAIRKYLEGDGFDFDDDEEGRWIMAGKPDRLLPYWIQAGLRCDRLGQQVYYETEVVSTQDIAFELMVEGKPHGTLVVAEHQTGGRGRGKREWHSTPYQGLQFSLLLDMNPPDTFASVMTIALATAVARAIQDVAGVPARIKFPNDVLVRGKKVAGILLEVKDYGDGVPRRAVAGVGINVNQLAEELPAPVRETATSLRAERRGQEPVGRPRLLRYILRELEKWLERIAEGEFQDLENAWNRFAAMEGKTVTFRHGADEKVEGKVLDASIQKGLLLRLDDGSEKRYRLEHLNDVRFA